MKAYLFFLPLLNVFLLTQLVGQHKLYDAYIEHENTTHYYEGDELWINDTINYYEGLNENWQPTKRLVVLSRDGLGQELETILEYYHPETDTWKTRIKNQKSYYYFQHAHFLKESKTHIWNNVHKKWIETSKKTFDKSGKIIESYNVTWDPDKSIADDGIKSVYNYDEEGTMEIITNHKWDVNNGNWERLERISRLNQSASHVVTEERERWDKSKSKWILAGKTTSTKDKHDRLIDQEEISFDETGKKAILTNHSSIIYNEDGQVIEKKNIRDLGYRKTGTRELNLYPDGEGLLKKTRFSYDPVNDIWVPLEEKRFTYDRSGEKTMTLVRSWNNENDQWENKYRESFLQDLDRKEKLVQDWNSKMLIWTNVSSEVYEFTGNDLKSSLTRLWNNRINDWENISRKHYEFSEYGKTSEYYEEWESGTTKWIGKYENSWTYDESGNIIGYEFMELDNGSYALKEKATFGWHMFALSKTESKENYTIEVFPNPTKGVLHIKSIAGTLERVAILDQAGQLLEAVSLDQASTTIDISYLPSGNYLLECISGIQTNTFKVVKL